MKIKRTPYQITMEILALLCLLGVGLYLLLGWNNLPDRIPNHFNDLGEADKWTGKSFLLFLFGIQAAIWLFITILSLFPKRWNLPADAGEHGRPLLLAATQTLLCNMKLILCAAFDYVIYQTAVSKQFHLFIGILLVIAILISLIYYFVRITRISLSEARRLLKEDE